MACVDLLGFSRVVLGEQWDIIERVYETAIQQLEEGPASHSDVYHAWFSDTFLFYTQDDSVPSFRSFELRVRSFCETLITQDVPIRGAMSVGEFAAYPQKAIYVGQPLVDAYRQCEDQNWIGFSVTPQAVDHLKEHGLRLEASGSYRYWDIPRNTGNSRGEGVLALILGGVRRDLTKNPCYQALGRMASEAPKDHVRTKYDHSLRFLEKFGVGEPMDLWAKNQ